MDKISESIISTSPLSQRLMHNGTTSHNVISFNDDEFEKLRPRTKNNSILSIIVKSILEEHILFKK